MSKPNKKNQDVLQETGRSESHLPVSSLQPTVSQKIAEAVVDGTLVGATAHVYANANSMLDTMDLVESMKKAGNEVVAGDFSRVERILTYQLVTLNEMFNNLAQRALPQGYRDAYTACIQGPSAGPCNCRDSLHHEEPAALYQASQYCPRASAGQQRHFFTCCRSACGKNRKCAKQTIGAGQA